MLHWPTPTTLRELQGFLELTRYYRRFVARYGTLAWPLTQLFKRDSFHWDVAATEAFSRLKHAMTTVSVLALPDFTQLLVVEADASGHGLRAMLMQNNRSLTYFSRILSSRARLQSAYERKELMAIVLAICK